MAIERLRKPAIVPRAPEPAQPFKDDPGEIVRAHFQLVWETAMHDMPFVNPALTVEVGGFQRVDGDWIGVVITPWFINLFLLPGGGSLWADWPSGEQRSVELPVGVMDFIADNPGAEAILPAYQYCPLVAPVQSVADQTAARDIAAAAMETVLAPPPATEATPEGAASEVVVPAPVVTTPASEAPASSPRRGFLRKLAGHRD
ncbi:MAG TPA: [NiFe]-hydrogenase assembly chaperone HybE [Rhodocyclaceae bacterium]